ncbi:putative secreted protein [Wickerhamomyces ciferrii]|uniref:Secreted protein n=1 Tax=Wickerhamomyces ciferrii (strain ATCC 14091 / BCRC 22168 / CBS 111 / JCM 3599 / NBRC 0793 / NRRL Y-1031 F-60-10) TaxID=1206466 RepID=K0KKS7_WICCF|nr:uncharacterized protein BN7_2296 [Wickerhamomyces ciferrii]CCH42752.1 putative secreted protein [Wickerhamomyces ciferrii]
MWLPLSTLALIAQTALAASSHIIQLNTQSTFGEFSAQGSSINGLNLNTSEDDTIEIGNFKAVVAEIEDNILDHLLSLPIVNTIFPNAEISLFDTPTNALTHKTPKRSRQVLQKRSESVFDKRDDGVTTQSNAPRHLARLSSRSGIFNESSLEYNYKETGKGITAYVIDSGISVTHPDFEGRAKYGVNLAGGSNEPVSKDETGHGTNVAGILGSKTYGVAKDVEIIDVKVFGYGGTTYTKTILKGIEWANNDRKNKSSSAVANLSLGGQKSQALDQAVEAAFDDGLAVIVAAGNANKDASTYSPASAKNVITVGALDDRSDTIAIYSNYGPDVDVFASGVAVESLNSQITGPPTEYYGTSQATPVVAGLAATLLEKGISKDQLKDEIIKLSTKNAISEETFENNSDYDNTVNRVANNGVESTDDEIDDPSTQEQDEDLREFIGN